MRGVFSPGAGHASRLGVPLRHYWKDASGARHCDCDDPLSDLFAFGPVYGLTAVANEQAETSEGRRFSGGYSPGSACS